MRGERVTQLSLGGRRADELADRRGSLKQVVGGRYGHDAGDKLDHSRAAHAHAALDAGGELDHLRAVEVRVERRARTWLKLAKGLRATCHCHFLRAP